MTDARTRAIADLIGAQSAVISILLREHGAEAVSDELRMAVAKVVAVAARIPAYEWQA